MWAFVPQGRSTGTSWARPPIRRSAGLVLELAANGLYGSEHVRQLAGHGLGEASIRSFESFEISDQSASG